MRYFTSGYFLTPLDDYSLLCGRRYENAFPCGMVGEKAFTFILFAPDYAEQFMDNPDGEHSEKFDLALEFADRFSEQPLFVKALAGLPTVTDDFLGYSERALRLVSDAINAGLSFENALSMHVARLIPEYAGETFEECVERGFLRIVNGCPNIWQCSQEGQ